MSKKTILKEFDKKFVTKSAWVTDDKTGEYESLIIENVDQIRQFIFKAIDTTREEEGLRQFDQYGHLYCKCTKCKKKFKKLKHE